MHVIGKIKSINSTNMIVEIDGDANMTEQIKAFGDADLVFDITKYHKKRSISANGYFWVLVGKISTALGTDKESVYKWLIKDAGVYQILQVVKDALPQLKRVFRDIEILSEWVEENEAGEKTMVEIMGFYGSSTYDSKEMAHLIDVTRQEAVKLGIDVWTESEIRGLFNE